MLVESMSRKEITREILNDYYKIRYNSTLNRLGNEYEQERTKRHIKKEAEYARCYEIKTKSKNRWVLVLYKQSMIKKFQSKKDCAIMHFAYYHTNKGICVFIVKDSNLIEVYYGHLFARYRERMGLDIPNLLDVAIHYFKINSTALYTYLPGQDGKMKFFSIVKDGFILGEKDKENRWDLMKTFIPKTTANTFSTSERNNLIKEMKAILIKQDPNEEAVYYQDFSIFLESLKKEEKDEKKKDVSRLMPVPELLAKEVHQPGLDFVDFIKKNVQ